MEPSTFFVCVAVAAVIVPAFVGWIVDEKKPSHSDYKKVFDKVCEETAEAERPKHRLYL